MRPPPQKRSLILDPVNPRDYRELTIIHYCEQCCHFDARSQTCSIGYDASKHMKAEQERLYNLCGKLAFCRFCEID